jgi:hypothetical protein
MVETVGEPMKEANSTERVDPTGEVDTRVMKDIRELNLGNVVNDLEAIRDWEDLQSLEIFPNCFFSGLFLTRRVKEYGGEEK